MPLLVHPVLRALAVHRQAVELPRQADREVAHVDHLLHFAQALGEDLAGLERDEPPELFLVRAQLLAELADDLAAPRRRDHAPGRERLGRGAHDGLVVVGGRLTHAPDRLAGGGVVGDELGAAGFDPGARSDAPRLVAETPSAASVSFGWRSSWDASAIRVGGNEMVAGGGPAAFA